MTEPLSKIPNGMRYYFGQEARLRRSVEQIVMSVFDGWSYEEITTPTVDYYSLFEHGMGSSEAHRAFRFTDTDGRLLALRPDVTSGVARAAVTMFAERDRPLRLCYAAPVFRQQPQSHTEWRRESTQTGCELIGANTSASDMEVLAIASEVLQHLGLDGNYLITLNDVGIFNGIAKRLALDVVSRDEMRQLVDSRNAADLDRFLIHHEFAPEERQVLAQLTQLSGKRETLESARRVITNAGSSEALDRLERLWPMIESLDLADHFEIDLGDVARLDYYTGLTFNIYVNGAAARVGSGGRYDGLTSAFGKAEPAVGFVLDLDALTTVLLARKVDPNFPQEPERKMSHITNSDPSLLFGEAMKKRAEGERVLINFDEVTRCRN
ncbi:MAG: ATP phosphoribosyltransferase regulatory subunit [Acidobacteriota bacterium]